MLCKVAFGELAHSISVLRVQTLVYCDLTNYALLLLRTHGRGSIYPPPPPLVPRWGYEFACHPRVKVIL